MFKDCPCDFCVVRGTNLKIKKYMLPCLVWFKCKCVANYYKIIYTKF